MNFKNTASSAAQIIREPLETLTSQTVKPIADEAIAELGFFGSPKNLGRAKTLAQEDLSRARNEEKIKDMDRQDQEHTQAKINKIREEYIAFDVKIEKQDEAMQTQITELHEEIAKLIKESGLNSKLHLENAPKKVGSLHIKLLVSVIRYLRLKAEESKSANELVAQRKNAKPATGMLAWVSGKQMKVHEQGTLQLQG